LKREFNRNKEESKQGAIKSTRLSDKFVETKSGFFGGAKPIVFPSKDRLA
jgi:hypothetical protein